MILVDTKVFLRFLASPVTPEDQAMAATARELFEVAERGDTEITTTEIVLHEVAYMLAAQGHNAHSVEQTGASVAAILRFPGFRLPKDDQQRYLRALDLWLKHPVLGFSDSLLAVTALDSDMELASFDRHFARVPALRNWDPSPGKSNG